MCRYLLLRPAFVYFRLLSARHTGWRRQMPGVRFRFGRCVGFERGIRHRLFFAVLIRRFLTALHPGFVPFPRFYCFGKCLDAGRVKNVRTQATI